LIEKIPHLQSLGVNAVELLPVQAKYSEDLLLNKGLSNYWGYNTAAFFALEPGYGSRKHPGCEIDEFKLMIRELHKAGMEVILDVVYNHTAEGTELGPMLSLRGLDNRSYYALTGPEDAPLRHYRNYTGCGNTLDFGSPAVLRLALDSLRYFVEEFHVDGFRFDLATVLGRQGGSPYDPNAPFFAAAAQDPVLRQVKLISEPWDVDAYAVGNFPDGWMEWNGGFRDVTRRWVRGESGVLAALRDKLEGSPEVYESAGREPWSSVNFVTSHDGFTLLDWTRYEQKRNQANGEDNWDGSNENHGWNCGQEGESGDAEVETLRQRQVRNLLLLAALARGTPMFLGGDELLRTQAGNNNAYCQDNPVSWYDWNRADSESGFLRFFREAVKGRKNLALPNAWTSIPGRSWGRCWQGWDASGSPWIEDKAPDSRHAAFLLYTAPGAIFSSRIAPKENGSHFYLLLNTGDEEKTFNLPALPPPWCWARVADTSLPSPFDIEPAGSSVILGLGERYSVPRRTSVLLHTRETRPERGWLKS
jgi:glycogen operon protein